MSASSSWTSPPPFLLIVVVVVALAVDVSHEMRRACPARCVCSEDGGDDKSVVNCNGLNLTDIPATAADSGCGSLLLERNAITLVDLAFLRHYPDLETLSFRDNNIRSLSKTTDEDYRPSSFFLGLTHLDLSNNHLHVLHPYVLTGFPSLKTLNLSGNALHTVARGAMTLPALQTLDMSRNALEVVRPHFFDTSHAMAEIDLSRNRVSRLNDGVFGLIAELALLDLSHNQIIRLEDNVLIGMNVSHLDLGFNSLRRTPRLPLRKLTAAKTIVLDGNPISVLEAGALRDVRAEFVSISRCDRLYRVDGGAVADMPDLQTLTANNNPRLTYVDPDAVAHCPRLAALDLSRNGLFSLEARLPKNLPGLKALYLAGNNFRCHCSLGWLSHLGDVLRDSAAVSCRPNDDDEMEVTVDQMEKFAPECEPYILPLFPASQTEMMGRNVSWLCKALGGGDDMSLVWRLPGGRGSKSIDLTNGECEERACVNGNALTVRYLHPAKDEGRYTCVAKNKFGQDQRKIALDVKVL